MEFYTKIAGVTFDGRQRLIYELKRRGELDSGTELVLKREPHNQYDSNAIAVLTHNGDHLGYIPRETAACLAADLDSGKTYGACVSDVTGGDVGTVFGINIKIENIVYDTKDNKQEIKTMYSKMIFESFKEALYNMNFHFKEDIKKGTIIVPSIGIDSSIESITLLIEVRDDDCILHVLYDNFKISSVNMPQIAELLMRINDSYIFPQFVLNYDNQNVRCQYRPLFNENNADCESARMIMGHIIIPAEKYANSILAVSLGLQSPKDAFNNVERNN